MDTWEIGTTVGSTPGVLVGAFVAVEVSAGVGLGGKEVGVLDAAGVAEGAVVAD
jgi:hypothetical protein